MQYAYNIPFVVTHYAGIRFHASPFKQVMEFSIWLKRPPNVPYTSNIFVTNKINCLSKDYGRFSLLKFDFMTTIVFAVNGVSTIRKQQDKINYEHCLNIVAFACTEVKFTTVSKQNGRVGGNSYNTVIPSIHSSYEIIEKFILYISNETALQQSSKIVFSDSNKDVSALFLSILSRF